MATSSIRSLQALVSLANIDLGEAALELADRLDEQAQAVKAVRECEGRLTQLGAVYERLSQPGSSIYMAPLSVLARQSAAGNQVLHESQAKLTQVEQSVDEQKQCVHQHQSRHENLSKFLKTACLQHALSLEKKSALEHEDLFLARRYLTKDHA